LMRSKVSPLGAEWIADCDAYSVYSIVRGIELALSLWKHFATCAPEIGSICGN